MINGDAGIMGEHDDDGLEYEIHQDQVLRVFGRKHHLIPAHKGENVLPLRSERQTRGERERPAEKQHKATIHHARIPEQHSGQENDNGYEGRHNESALTQAQQADYVVDGQQ